MDGERSLTHLSHRLNSRTKIYDYGFLEMPEVWIDPGAGGRLTPEALLRPTGSVDVDLGSRRFPSQKVCIFHIAGDDFWFNLGFLNGKLVFQRREYSLEMTESFFRKLKGNTTVIASWTFDSLILLLGPRGFVGPSIRKVLKIEPRPAPVSLIRWARTQSLMPTIEHETEADFVSRVHSGLSLLQDKIDAMHNRDIFWDIEYAGQRVVSRRPKKERDLHGAIQALLSDQFFLSSIDVIPEVHTGAGNLDFLFTGAVKGSGIAKVCAEFKLAHSASLYRGIESQLPAYMRAQNTDNGTYCVLDFRGEWFDDGPADEGDMNLQLAVCAKRGWPLRSHPIKVHRLYLGRSRRASELK
jgi:hypothetical protein